MNKKRGKVKVCRVEYETKDRTNWKAVILAFDMQDAIDYIRKNVMGFDKYISTQILADVDAIEDNVFNSLFVGETKVVETVIHQKGDDEGKEASSDDDGPVCPWCEKQFKTNNTLGIHIKKYHM